MADLTGKPNTVSLKWSNIARAYIRNQKIGNQFRPSWAENSAILVDSFVIVRGSRICPGGTGVQKIIRIPGTIQYHAYSGSNIGTLRGGKLITPGKTWEQCGIGRGMWYITATFTPTQCWTNIGIRKTRAVTPPLWICNPCRPWPNSCGC